MHSRHCRDVWSIRMLMIRLGRSGRVLVAPLCRTGGATGLAAGSKSDAGAAATIRLQAMCLLRDALAALVRPSAEVLAAQRQLRQAREAHAAAERRREEVRAQEQQDLEQEQQRPAEAITEPGDTGQGGSHAEGAAAGAVATGVAEGGAGVAAMEVDAPDQAAQQPQQEKQLQPDEQQQEQQQQASAAGASPAPEAAPEAAEVREEPHDVEATAAAVGAAAAALAQAEVDHARTSRPHAALLLRCRLALACHALRRAVLAARTTVSYNASVTAALQAAGDLRHATAEFYPLLRELRACCGSKASAAGPAAGADAEGWAVPPACLPWLRHLQRRLVAWLCALQNTVTILEPPTAPGTGTAGATGAAAAAGGPGAGAGAGAAHGPGGHGRLSSRHNTVRALRMVMVEACGGVLCAWRLDPTAARGPAECCALLQALTAALCCSRPGLPAAIAAGQCAAAASGALHAAAAAGAAGQAAVAGSAQAAGAGAGAAAQGQQAAGATNPTADLLPFLREALDLLDPQIAHLAGYTPTTSISPCPATAGTTCASPRWHPAAPSDSDMRRASAAAPPSPARLATQPLAEPGGGAGASGGDPGTGREGGGGGGAICVEPSRWPGLVALHVLKWREGEEEDKEDKDSSSEEEDDEKQGGKGRRSGAGGADGKGRSKEGVDAAAVGGGSQSRDENLDDATVQAAGDGEGGAAAVDAVAQVEAGGEEQQPHHHHQHQRAHRLTLGELERMTPMEAAVAVWRALEHGPAATGAGGGRVAATQAASGSEQGHEARLVLLRRLCGAQAQLLWLMHGLELPWRDQAWGTGLPSGTVGAGEQQQSCKSLHHRNPVHTARLYFLVFMLAWLRAGSRGRCRPEGPPGPAATAATGAAAAAPPALPG